MAEMMVEKLGQHWAEYLVAHWVVMSVVQMVERKDG
jgi:hypothetical protein